MVVSRRSQVSRPPEHQGFQDNDVVSSNDDGQHRIVGEHRVHLTPEFLEKAKERPNRIFPVETVTDNPVFFFQNELYDSYEAVCKAKRENNDRRMEELGLLGTNGVVNALKKQSASPKKRKTPPKRKDTPPAKLRRSGRTRNKPVEFTGESIDNVVEHKTTLRRATKPLKAKKQLEPLTSEQLAKLKDAEEWLDDFKRFLLTVPHGRSNKVCSGPNASCVVRQVRKLISGEGIGYAHWKKDVLFCKSEAIQLSHDMASLFDRAQDHENEHGRDLGNGWLLRHPIEKLRCYQEYRAR